jgi:dTMP kinase
MKKGLFISFEGIEGSGKSTQAKLLKEYLLKSKYNVVLTVEPGGTLIGEEIRRILLSLENKNMLPKTELLLYNASRAQHIEELILPSLEDGKVVITDRFTDSTIAYQGYGRGIDLSLILDIDRIVNNSLRPNVTILLDLDVEEGLRRNRGINKRDRLEFEEIEFHKRVRVGYLEIASKERDRIKIIDASGSIEDVHEKIKCIITEVLERWG